MSVRLVVLVAAHPNGGSECTRGSALFLVTVFSALVSREDWSALRRAARSCAITILLQT
jgi:hypothetical protein